MQKKKRKKTTGILASTLWTNRTDAFSVYFCGSTFRRNHVIRKSHEEKTVEVEERVEQVLRQGQKDLQETRTKHKKELAKVNLTLQMNLDCQIRLLFSQLLKKASQTC